MFNIIITKRNKTAIAPTYITRKETGRNSNCNKKSNEEALQKERMRKRTE
jgi:hypothetical protein